MTNSDLILYVDDRASLALLRRLNMILGAEPAVGPQHPLNGAVYTVRHTGMSSDSVDYLRQRLNNEADWGTAEGMLVFSEGTTEQRWTRAVDMPEYPMPAHGREVTESHDLAPGRRYMHSDGRVRTYIHNVGGYEGFEWYEGEPGNVERLRAPVANLPGPWTEHVRDTD